jgi:hypothetical protein
MKNRKNILTYIVAAFSILVILASSSPGAQPQVYLGKLTHGEFVSCEGQILDPPAYAVGGTWVLSIDAMTQPLVPPPAHLTMIVLRDGSFYLAFPHIELTPVSLQDGIYTYTWETQVMATLDTNTTPATFAWHVVFDDNCTLRSRVADLLRSSQQLGHQTGWYPHRTWRRSGAMRDAAETYHFPIRQAASHRRSRTEDSASGRDSFATD